MPRYYDPQKEALKKRYQRIAAELGQKTDGNPGSTIDFSTSRRHTKKNQAYKDGIRKSNRRLLMVLFMILVLVYFWMSDLGLINF